MKKIIFISLLLVLVVGACASANKNEAAQPAAYNVWGDPWIQQLLEMCRKEPCPESAQIIQYSGSPGDKVSFTENAKVYKYGGGMQATVLTYFGDSSVSRAVVTLSANGLEISAESPLTTDPFGRNGALVHVPGEGTFSVVSFDQGDFFSFQIFKVSS